MSREIITGYDAHFFYKLFGLTATEQGMRVRTVRTGDSVLYTAAGAGGRVVSVKQNLANKAIEIISEEIKTEFKQSRLTTTIDIARKNGTSHKISIQPCPSDRGYWIVDNGVTAISESPDKAEAPQIKVSIEHSNTMPLVSTTREVTTTIVNADRTTARKVTIAGSSDKAFRPKSDGPLYQPVLESERPAVRNMISGLAYFLKQAGTKSPVLAV